MVTAVDPRWMLALSTQLCCVGVILQSLEVIWNRRELRDDDLLGWSAPAGAPANPAVALARWLYRYPACLGVLAVRAAAAGAVFFLPYGSAPVFALLGFLVVAQMYFNRRFFFIRGNSDHMKLVCLSAVCAGGLPWASPGLQAAALAFMAFQVGLAYVTSGYDKLRSPLWRDGTRLIQILEDGNYRFPPLNGRLRHHRRAVVACVWGVILLELLFPLCVVLPPAGFWLIIGGGIAFHASVGVTMGLHGFWWSFLATYPALYFVHAHVTALRGG